MPRDGKAMLTSIITASSVAAISAVAIHFHLRLSTKKLPENDVIVPLLNRSESDRAARLERFSSYVARQIGLEDESDFPQLQKLSYKYLKKSKECEAFIYEYFAKEQNAEELCAKLVEELERCILAYFAFHWSQASLMISQVLSVDSDQKRLKNLVIAATRSENVNLAL